MTLDLPPACRPARRLPWTGLLLGLLLLALPASAAPSVSRTPWGRGESAPDDLRIFLVTFGPDDEIVSWFGHTALGVEDQKAQVSRLYNYGMFSFSRTMLARFAMGRLEFWVGEDPVNLTLRSYARHDRDVRVQELDLPPEKRLEVATFLARNVLPENRTYLYHHYDDNCSTRPRDVLDLALGGAYARAMATPARMSLRDHTRRHSAVNRPMGVLLDYLMNDEIDRPLTRWGEAFLPAELEHQLDELEVPDASGEPRPLVSRKWTYYDSPRPETPETPPSNFGWLLGLGLLLGAVPVLLTLRGRSAGPGRARRVALGLHNLLVGLVFGIPGLALLVMWLVTNHTVTHRNENLLLANPLTFIALPLGAMFAWGSPRAARWLPKIWLALVATSVLGLLLKVLPAFDQKNAEFFALFLPLNLGCALAFALHARALRAVSVGPSSSTSSPGQAELASPDSGAAGHGTGRIAANR